MSDTILYFAYGSNMSTARLRYRLSWCEPMGRARLAGHRLRFHKRSVDGSGKCNIWRTDDPADTVIGVLYRLPTSQEPILDAIEGVGLFYHKTHLAVATEDGGTAEAMTYVAMDHAIDETLKPYDWYADFVLTGAREHGLPEDYVARFIASVETVRDPDEAHAAARRGEVHVEESGGNEAAPLLNP